MTPEQFAYWFQGIAETLEGTPPTPRQWAIIRDHLQTVFKKETPDRSKVERPRMPFSDPHTDKIC